jgi:hypothetical protein
MASIILCMCGSNWMFGPDPVCKQFLEVDSESSIKSNLRKFQGFAELVIFFDILILSVVQENTMKAN